MEGSEVKTDLGALKVVRHIAAGGMAEVFEAEISGPDGFSKTVAVKRPLPHLQKESAYTQMLLDEARLAARLHHPNIAQVYSCGRSTDGVYVIMEYVDGVPLSVLLQGLARKKEKLGPRLAVHIGSLLLDALQYAHDAQDKEGQSLKVIHRDVSPQNLLLSKEGDVKLVDFGVAKAEINYHQTRDGVVKGKVAYMAPEQLDDQKLDPRVRGGAGDLRDAHRAAGLQGKI
jgi:serine/threonine-protein kinase